MKTFNLTPKYRKSFNNKCKVIQENDLSTLQSYNTLICEYNHSTNKIKFLNFDKNLLSNTTVRHINAFLEFYGFNTYTKKELQVKYLS